MFRTNNKAQILGVTFLLASLLVLATTLSSIGFKAYAVADNSSHGNSTDNSHSDNNATGYGKSYAGQNNANMTSDNNSTNSNPKSDNGRGNSNMTDHSNNSMADQKRQNYVSESAEQRHSEHLSTHAQ